MDSLFLVSLFLCTVSSGWIASTTGLAGGVLLFAVLSLFYPPITVLALHGFCVEIHSLIFQLRDRISSFSFFLS